MSRVYFAANCNGGCVVVASATNMLHVHLVAIWWSDVAFWMSIEDAYVSFKKVNLLLWFTMIFRAFFDVFYQWIFVSYLNLFAWSVISTNRFPFQSFRNFQKHLRFHFDSVIFSRVAMLWFNFYFVLCWNVVIIFTALVLVMCKR